MGAPPDENLPEVVPPRPVEVGRDSSPQVVAIKKAEYDWQTSERDKYPVVFDTAPKLPDDATPKPIYGTTYPQTWSPGTEVNTATTQSTAVPWESLPAGSNNPPSQPPKAQRRICGLRRRVFFIIITVATLVVLGAAIGGGIGGTRSASQPTTLPVPQRFLNNGTAPQGLAFQAFSEPSYMGNATVIIQEEGFHDIGARRSYVWLPDDTKCCLTFCANMTTSTGWWCDARYRANASGVFSRVYIWCGGNDGVKNETCS